MKLQEFVREAMWQIVAGVAEAQAEAYKDGAYINPIDIAFKRDDRFHSYKVMTQEVHFDMVLTNSEESGASGGIGVFLGAVNVGSGGKVDTQTSAVTRVQFSVPIVFSLGKSLKEENLVGSPQTEKQELPREFGVPRERPRV